MSRRPLLIGEDLTQFVIDRDGVAVVPRTTCNPAAGNRATSSRALSSGTEGSSSPATTSVSCPCIAQECLFPSLRGRPMLRP